MARSAAQRTRMRLSIFVMLLVLALFWLVAGHWILDRFLHSGAGKDLDRWLSGLPPEARLFVEVIVSTAWAIVIGLISLVRLVRTWGRRRQEIEQQYKRRMEQTILDQRTTMNMTMPE